MPHAAAKATGGSGRVVRGELVFYLSIHCEMRDPAQQDSMARCVSDYFRNGAIEDFSCIRQRTIYASTAVSRTTLRKAPTFESGFCFPPRIQCEILQNKPCHELGHRERAAFPHMNSAVSARARAAACHCSGKVVAEIIRIFDSMDVASLGTGSLRTTLRSH
jgi:hypothetical protein